MIGVEGPKEVYGDFDVDIFHERYITYSSENADAARKWVAYIDIGGRDYLGIRFHGHSEEEALRRAKEAWNKERAKRESNILGRMEAVRKTAKVKARKGTT